MAENAATPPAGHSVRMIRPHLREIPRAPLPEGFSVRPMRLSEGDLWTDIVLDAEEWLDLSRDLFEREFGHDKAAVPERCFLLGDADGRAVGTISAWYWREEGGPDSGLVHWVAVRPAWQGRGLGKAGLAFALERLARWHGRALLHTSTQRLPAVALYLDFGFRPDLRPEGARAAWGAFRRRLPHPALEGLEL